MHWGQCTHLWQKVAEDFQEGMLEGKCLKPWAQILHMWPSTTKWVTLHPRSILSWYHILEELFLFFNMVKADFQSDKRCLSYGLTNVETIWKGVLRKMAWKFIKYMMKRGSMGEENHDCGAKPPEKHIEALEKVCKRYWQNLQNQNPEFGQITLFDFNLA